MVAAARAGGKIQRPRVVRNANGCGGQGEVVAWERTGAAVGTALRKQGVGLGLAGEREEVLA